MFSKFIMGQESKNKKEPSPFREELQPISPERNMSGHESKFRTLPNLGGKLIRMEAIDKRLEPGRGRFGRTHFEDYVRAREIFSEIRSRYGIAVPEMRMVALAKTSELTKSGDVDGGKMFTIVDDIEGKSLYETRCLPQEAAPQFERFFEKLIRYIIDSYAEKKPFLWDIDRAKQYVYGRKKEDKDNEIYLVDVDPNIVYPDSKVYGEEMLRFLENMWTFIADMEKKFSPPASFSGARQKLEEAIAQVAAGV